MADHVGQKFLSIALLGALVSVAALFPLFFSGPAAKAAGPSWSLTPVTWDFGTVIPGTGPTAPKEFTLTNTGTVGLGANFIGVGGNEGAGFSFTTDGCGTLAPGASCSIDVTFDPSTPGPKEGELQVSSLGGPVPPVSAELRGYGAGPEVSVSPETHLFSPLSLGEISEERTFLLTNTGSFDLTISWAAIVVFVNGDTDQFQLGENTCTAGSVIPPGGTCAVAARFAPTRPGEAAADLLFVSDAPGSPHRVTLQGSGLALSRQQPPIPPFTNPRVTIVRGPAKRTHRRHATFWLRGSPDAAQLACRLDYEEWFRACASPVLRRHLSPGRHRLVVRALDSSGRFGSPTVYRWRVEQR